MLSENQFSGKTYFYTIASRREEAEAHLHRRAGEALARGLLRGAAQALRRKGKSSLVSTYSWGNFASKMAWESFLFCYKCSCVNFFVVNLFKPKLKSRTYVSTLYRMGAGPLGVWLTLIWTTSCPAAQPILPSFQMPKQNWADSGMTETKSTHPTISPTLY